MSEENLAARRSTKAIAAGFRTPLHSTGIGDLGPAALGSERPSTINHNSIKDKALPSMAVTRDQHRKLQRLLVVEPRVDGRAIRPREVAVGQTARPARALGHIVAGQLEMHAAQNGAGFLVNAERRIDLRQDVLETPGLDALRRRLGITVHRVANPKHLLPAVAHRLDHAGQRALDLAGAEAVNQGQTA